MIKACIKLLPALTLMLGSISSLEASEPQSSTLASKTYPVTGTLHPIYTTNVSSQMAGRVQDVHVNVGDFVEKGQVLLNLDPMFFELEYKKLQNLSELAKISYEDAQLEFSRMKNLWEKPEGNSASIPKKQYDDAESRFKQKKLLLSQALIDLEHSGKRLEETAIKAPYKGIITKRFVDSGEAVTVMPVTPLFEIIDASKLIFEFSLSQEMLAKVKTGNSVTIHLDALKKTLEGKIEKVVQQVETSSRSFRCRVILDNHDLSLTPGCFVTAHIELN